MPNPISSMSSLNDHPVSASASVDAERSQPSTPQLLGVGACLDNNTSPVEREHDQSRSPQETSKNVDSGRLESVMELSTTSNLDCADRGITPVQNAAVIRGDSLRSSLDRSTATEPSPARNFHEAGNAPDGGVEPRGSTITQAHRHPPDSVDSSPSPTQTRMTHLVYMERLREGLTSSWAHLSLLFDSRTAVRFVVAIFSYLMGIATTLSVNIAPQRPADALPSLNDDGYPIMIAQIIASLVSPLLFSIVSTRERFIPIRQKMFSFYYLLLVIGVLMSLASLLLYSLWPAGYRITNVAIIASLMFTVLGGWQFLEKCWKEATVALPANQDIELGVREV
ncbi:hypothetical protein F5Y05DRAFT_217220 [Hypoxylon sp. FL0543]|nr:hypothetical protein F5Y05DRAFT_217220 [Hypoxylon sp. FL0543]